MIALEQINRGGSKLEITRALLEKDFKHIPDSEFFYAGQSLDSILSHVQQMLRKGSIICRGSHPNDYHGFVDVIPTVKNITSISELEDAIKTTQEFMAKPVVKQYSEINDGQSYDEPIIHFLIQQQSQARFAGQLLEHPHDRTIIFGDYNDVGYPFDSAKNIEINICDLSPIIFADHEGSLMDFYENVFVPLKETGVLDSSYSHNLEFCFDPESREMFFLQARPFKEFEAVADFDVLFGKYSPHVNFMCAFGVTPDTGFLLNTKSFMFRGNNYPLEFRDDNFGIADNYALFLDCFETRDSAPLEQKFDGLKVFMFKSNISFLSHATYRYMKRADVSLLGVSEGDIDYLCRCQYPLEFISNGDKSVAKLPGGF